MRTAQGHRPGARQRTHPPGSHRNCSTVPTKGAVPLGVDPAAPTSVSSQHAEDESPRCEQARQVHRFADHYQLAHGFYVEKCIGCGLTRAEVKDWRESHRGYGEAE